MPPKLRPVVQDPRAEFKPGIVTCTAEAFSDDSRLAFVVQGKIALVLDRKSLDDGQVIGILCEGDIVCASLVETPWLMVPTGSHVRHPAMREGRVKLQRDGWMVARHPQYGELMSAFPADKVRKFWDEDLYLKLPIVKVAKGKAKPKAAAPTPSAPRVGQDDEEERNPDEAMLPSRRAAAETARRDAEEAAAKAALASRQAASAQAALVSPQAQPAKAGSLAKATSASPAKAASSPKAVSSKAASSSKAAPAKATSSSTASVPSKAVAPAKAASSSNESLPSKAVPTKAVALAKGVRDVVKVAERAKAPPEGLDSHLRTCAGEHWKVVHDFVFVRSGPSTNTEHLGVMRRGSVFCLALASPAESRSPDGKWVKCSQDAKVWPKVDVTEPEFLFKASDATRAGYVLIKNEEHGDLLRLVPNTKPDAPLPGSKDPKEGSLKDNGKPLVELEPKAEPVTLEAMAKLDHWVVESEQAKVFVARDEESVLDYTFLQGDLLTLGGHSWARTHNDSSGKRWLLLPPHAQAYRKLEPLFPAAGYKKSGYVVIQDAESVLVRQYTPPETGVTVRLVSGYGEPWVVEHEQVVVRRGPSTSDVPVGIMLKGDVVGVLRKQGEWVELMQDSDVRFRKKGMGGSEASSTFLSSVNAVRERKVDEETLKKRREGGPDTSPVTPELPRTDSPITQAWMMVEHPTHGQLLRRARKRKGGLASGVVISKSRYCLYREVIELCHRRIYEENLEGLWDGERDKLPTPESIEAKLFDSQASVVHVTLKGKFCGGAIIKQVAVRAKQVEGSSNLNLTGMAAQDAEERPGRTTVGYIDSCAAEPGTGGGRMIWDCISNMHCVCLTCHSILLQKTVDFWQACGMRRLDPTSERDCEEFKRNVLVHTMGKVICELPDVEKELPTSKLPLFVWVPSRFSQASVDPHSEYVFMPDDHEGYYL